MEYPDVLWNGSLADSLSAILARVAFHMALLPPITARRDRHRRFDAAARCSGRVVAADST